MSFTNYEFSGPRVSFDTYARVIEYIEGGTSGGREYPITLSADGRTLGTIWPGEWIELEAPVRSITIDCADEVKGTIGAGTVLKHSRRSAGRVQTVEGGLAMTLDGNQYTTSIVLTPQAGLYPLCGLYNAGTNPLIVRRVRLSTNSGTGVLTLFRAGPHVGAEFAVSLGMSKSDGFLTAKSTIRAVGAEFASTAALQSGIFPDYSEGSRLFVGTSMDLLNFCPVILPPGKTFGAVSKTVGQTAAMFIECEEML